MNILFSQQQLLFSGPHGSLRISDDDVLSRRLAMLLQGQCEDSSVSHAAALFGYSRQRYYQLLQCFEKQGTLGLLPDTPGPKSDYRRTEQIIRLVIRYRFLDPDCSVDVVAQKLRQQGHTISTRSVERIVADYGLQKKLYALNPANPPQFVQSQRTRRQQRRERADPKSLEQQVRQLLADKVSGNQIGIWLLVPEHLRLGTWDLLLRWTDQPTPQLEPRLALHVVNEAALCLCSYRQGRSLAQKGFEAANGLPFVPSDQAIHEMLDHHTVQQSQELQIALGKLRRAGKHFIGRLLAMDPHRMGSYSKRRMRLHRFSRLEKPGKMGQAFFLLDGDTGQPVCFTLLSSAQSVSEASPELLRLAAEILPRPAEGKPLVLTDKEHYTQELFADVQTGGIFDLLSAVCAYPNCVRRWQSIPQSSFAEHWPGYATAVQPYQFKEDPDRHYHELVQRNGLREQDWEYQGFLATSLRPEVPSLTKDFPARWHVEEFFKFDQDLGWNRAGTLNLNVRYGQLTLALVAQAALHQLRQRLGSPVSSWDSQHLARNLLGGLEGDLRVQGDTIKVTVYNAPNATLLQSHYEDLPRKLERQGVNPRIPWLYNFKLDFRFT